jgi:hypothetical protein
MSQSTKDRSAGAALGLTFFFGPLGLLYSTIWGGLILTVIAAISAILTVGLSLLLIWPIAMVWGTVAASNRHSRFERGLHDGTFGITPAQQAQAELHRQQWEGRELE